MTHTSRYVHNELIVSIHEYNVDYPILIQLFPILFYSLFDTYQHCIEQFCVALLIFALRTTIRTTLRSLSATPEKLLACLSDVAKYFGFVSSNI